MALFLSTYVNKVDRKGRISVPATFRAALATQSYQGIVAFPSFRESYDAIEACGMDRMESLSESVDRLDPFTDVHDDLASVIFGAAAQLPFDGEGRIVLPEGLREHARIADQAAFVGRGRTFQIWHPDSLRAFETEARTRAREARGLLRLGAKGEGDDA